MSIRHDYHDSKCGATFEVIFDSAMDFKREMPCACGGVASQVWLRAPGLAGVSEPGSRGIARSFEPGYDIQSGRVFNDRAERDRYCKEKGIVLMGAQEHKRSMLAAKSVEPDIDTAKLKDAMERSYAEVKAGRRERPAVLDEAIPIMEATNHGR